MLEDTLTLEVQEQSLDHEQLEVMERQVAGAEEALVCWDAMIHGESNERVAGVRRPLAEDDRRRLKLQETRLCTRRDELKDEADSLKKKLAAAERREKVVVDAHAAVEVVLSFLYK